MQTSRVGGSYLQDDNRRPPRNMKNQKPPFENNIPKKVSLTHNYTLQYEVTTTSKRTIDFSPEFQRSLEREWHICRCCSFTSEFETENLLYFYACRETTGTQERMNRPETSYSTAEFISDGFENDSPSRFRCRQRNRIYLAPSPLSPTISPNNVLVRAFFFYF